MQQLDIGILLQLRGGSIFKHLNGIAGAHRPEQEDHVASVGIILGDLLDLLSPEFRLVRPHLCGHVLGLGSSPNGHRGDSGLERLIDGHHGPVLLHRSHDDNVHFPLDQIFHVLDLLFLVRIGPNGNDVIPFGLGRLFQEAGPSWPTSPSPSAPCWRR